MLRRFLLVSVLLAVPHWAQAGSATLDWVDPTLGPGQSAPTGHKIYRSTDTAVCDNASAVLPLFLTVTTLTTAYTDNTVPNVVGKVCYEVTATNAGGDSPRSNRVWKATTVNPPPPPTLVVR